MNIYNGAKKVYINIDIALNDRDAIIRFISSDRSDGKTTHIIAQAFDTFSNYGKIAVIARRWVNDITDLWLDTLFTNLRKVREVGELTRKGSPKKSGVKLYNNGKCFAVVIPLSRAGSVKSAFDWATHKNLYIDEYIPLDGRYIKNEVEAILEIYRTIDRDHFDNYVLICSNHITASCPLFSYFNVYPRDGVSRWKNGRFLMLQVANKGNRAAVVASPLGELTAGTAYGDYAAGGLLITHTVNIQTTHTREYMPFYIRHNGALYAFYLGKDASVILDNVPIDKQREDVPIYTTTPNAGTLGGIYLPYAQKLIKRLRGLYYTARIYAASERIFDDCRELWKMLGEK